MDIINICQNLLFSLLVSSIIGYNRETKNSPAGLRTYNLVCLGAVIITMISKELGESAIEIVKRDPTLVGVVSVDPTKIIAQIVSGIGFLGAGTIIVSKRKVHGLSTASSLWVSAAIGIAVGLDYYSLALISSLLVVFILAIFNKVIPVKSLRMISITLDDKASEKLIESHFKHYNMLIKKIETKVSIIDKKHYITNLYTLKLDTSINEHDQILLLADIKGVTQVEVIDI